MLNTEQIMGNIPNALDRYEVPGDLPRGKVRDFYILPDGKRRVLITTDRLSVFDHPIGLVPYKGQVLNQLSAWWFGQTTKIIPNHFVDMPDPNVAIVRETRPLPLEVIARGYFTGVTPTSLWGQYATGARSIYGLTFPDGLKKNQVLPQPIITATTKSTVGHDDRQMLTDVTKFVDADTWNKVKTAALALYQRGQKIAAQGGMILVDSKYEFGIDEETGDLLLIDELHTPDSSRYWKADSYSGRFARGEEPESFDREMVRLWYVAQGMVNKPPQADPEFLAALSQRYQQVYEMITGMAFEPADYPAQERIDAALAEYA